MDREHLSKLLDMLEGDLWEADKALFQLRRSNTLGKQFEALIPLVRLALLVKAASRMNLASERSR